MIDFAMIGLSNPYPNFQTVDLKVHTKTEIKQDKITLANLYFCPKLNTVKRTSHYRDKLFLHFENTGVKSKG